MEEAGFVNVVDNLYNDPVGSWSDDPDRKMIGEWTVAELEIGLEGLALAMLTRVLKYVLESDLKRLSPITKHVVDFSQVERCGGTGFIVSSSYFD